MRSIERVLLLILVGVAIFDHAGKARAGGDARALSASEFTLVSDQGKPMGSFHITPEGMPELVLVDEKGHGRIVLAVKRTDDAIIGITDAAGRVRAGLSGEADGRHSISLSDEAMVPRVSLSVASKGLSRVSVLSAKKKELVGLGVDEHELAQFWVTNDAGDSRLECGPVGSSGVFGLYLLGKTPTPRIGLELDVENFAHVFAQDVAGKARAELQAMPDSIPSVTLKDKYGKKMPIK